MSATQAVQPRRQSCDRCHERKVRCIQTPGPGTVIGSDAEPCQRCRKAGIRCSYSPQLRSGRPPLRRAGDRSNDSPEVSALNVRRRRRRRSSTCSSIVAVVPSPLTPESDPSLASSLFPATCSPFSMSSTTSSPNTMDPLLSPPLQSGPTSNGLGIFHIDTDIDPEFRDQTHWFIQDEASILGTGLDDSYLEDIPTDLVGVAPSSSFLGTGTGTPLPGTEMSNLHTDADMDPTEKAIRDIYELNLRVYRATRAANQDSARFCLGLSSPSVAEVFDAACSFGEMMGRLVSPKPQDRDMGIVLMMLACHERLMSALEAINMAMGQHVRSTQLAPWSTMQVVMVTKLIGHLLNKIDRAMAVGVGESLVEEGGMVEQPSGSSSSSSSGSELELETPPSESRQACGGDGTRQGLGKCSRVAQAAVDTMQARQNRLRAHIRVVKGMLRKGNGM